LVVVGWLAMVLCLIADSTITFEDQTHAIGDTFTLDMLKGQADNPKICAFLLVKGSKAGT
jgi:hypothetical protein